MKSFPYMNFRWTRCCTYHFEIRPSITFSCSLCNYWSSLPQHINTLKQNTVMIVWWNHRSKTACTTVSKSTVKQWHHLLWNSWLCSLKLYIQCLMRWCVWWRLQRFEGRESHWGNGGGRDSVFQSSWPGLGLLVSFFTCYSIYRMACQF